MSTRFQFAQAQLAAAWDEGLWAGKVLAAQAVGPGPAQHPENPYRLARSMNDLSGKQLAQRLDERGWARQGGRDGLYVRYAPPPEETKRGSVLVPLDESAGDYEELLVAAKATLNARRPSAAALLGVDPDYLGGQSVDEYIDDIRRDN